MGKRHKRAFSVTSLQRSGWSRHIEATVNVVVIFLFSYSWSCRVNYSVLQSLFVSIGKINTEVEALNLEFWTFDGFCMVKLFTGCLERPKAALRELVCDNALHCNALTLLSSSADLHLDGSSFPLPPNT
jgi:hypothetical protein